MVMEADLEGSVLRETSKVTCTGKNTGLVGRIDDDTQTIARNQLFCEFEGEEKESKYVDRLVVDGNVRYTKKLHEGGDISNQVVEVSMRQEPLKVRRSRHNLNTLVVTTESAEEQENREEGEMETPDLEPSNHSSMKKNQVVTKLACKDDQPDAIGKAHSDCVITTSSGEIQSVAKVNKIDILGDVEILDAAKERSMKATPRNSITESNAEKDGDYVNLKLEDRRSRMQGGREL